MDYVSWRRDVFDQPPDSNPILLRLQSETIAMLPTEIFDHIDRALDDVEIHDLFSRDQIGIGLDLIYSNNCSDMCYCYIEAANDERRTKGIRQLEKLYANFFDRYCQAAVTNIGSSSPDGRMGQLCHMLWDIFVLHPGNDSPGMITAALDVMASALQFTNDNCIVSAIHGLGHWALDEPRAVEILKEWLDRPTTTNASVMEYAACATTGCIQ